MILPKIKIRTLMIFIAIIAVILTGRVERFQPPSFAKGVTFRYPGFDVAFYYIDYLPEQGVYFTIWTGNRPR